MPGTGRGSMESRVKPHLLSLAHAWPHVTGVPITETPCAPSALSTAGPVETEGPNSYWTLGWGRVGPDAAGAGGPSSPSDLPEEGGNCWALPAPASVMLWPEELD